MNDSHIISIAQIREFLKLGREIQFKAVSRKQRYEWIDNVLTRFRYLGLKKKDKGAVRKYLIKMTGLSQSQLTKIIAKKKKYGKILLSSTAKHKFTSQYTPSDIAQLIETDKAHSRLSGKATKRIFERECNIYKNPRFRQLQNISVSHIYNLRKTNQYQSNTRFFQKTKPSSVNIGERRKPDNQGKPGYLRIDTVHQGDLVGLNNSKKGVYHINIVDEITQWEIVGAVQGISERFLNPLLQNLLSQFPFKIINFHSDNGSEFINKVVAKLLNKLLIRQTKSRPRHCNDNALTETKNGSVIRKHLGYNYIPQKHADKINQFYKNYFNPYLNYHRPCGFATLKTNTKGKVKKIYNVYQTPFERLQSNSRASQSLKKSISMLKLEKIAQSMSDNESAKQMQNAKEKLFANLKN